MNKLKQILSTCKKINSLLGDISLLAIKPFPELVYDCRMKLSMIEEQAKGMIGDTLLIRSLKKDLKGGFPDLFDKKGRCKSCGKKAMFAQGIGFYCSDEECANG